MEKYTSEELQLFIKFINNQNQTNNLSKEEFSKVSEIYKKSRTNQDLKNILEKLTNNPSDSKKIVDEYLNTVDLTKDEDTVLSQIYDVDVSEIEHKFLEDGKEIINFHCNKLNRNIVFEKEKNGIPLKEQLMQAQEENKQFQTDNASENTNSILEKERVYGNAELKMVPINKLGEYDYLIMKLPPDKLTGLEYMIKNADQLHIDTINIENVFGMTSKEYGSKIYESYYDVERNKTIIEQPEETISNKEENYEQELSNEDETRAAIEEMSSEEMKKVEMYRNYPELLNSLDSVKKEHYQQLIKRIDEKEAQLEKPKVYVFRKDIKKAGFIDAAILAFITEFVGLIFTTLVILACR